ncbi:MAG: alpha-amylase family protein [Tepidisphaeraceae bacterium]
MKTPFAFPFRQVHLDFHTGPAVPDVGRDFDARQFARAMKDAYVNSVTVFAKCHHGHLYYDTKRPERHPGLKAGLNLLAEQVEALHRQGIRAPIYLSVQCDEYAANAHPEWVARKPDGGQVKSGGVFDPGWQILDMSTLYQEYLAEQTREVLKLFHPVDGIFFDMCWDQPSTTKSFLEQMRARGGNPQNEEDRRKYAHELALAYMKRFHGMVRQSSPDAAVYFNGRAFWNLAEEIRYQEQVEIEALPTGGWGYVFFAKNARFVRNFKKPYLGMTARFHKSWADFGGLKPYPALEYETSQMIALGARCSIGDQLHPRGVPDPAAYELIGKVYKRVAQREPWLVGARPVTEIGLFQAPADARGDGARVTGADEGATRLLMQLKMQFDVVDATSDLSGFRLLILPDAVPVNAALARNLGAYVRAGGAVLASGTSGLNPAGTQSLLPMLGIDPHGMSPFTATYVRFGPEIDRDVPNTEHVVYDPGVRVTPRRGTQVVAWVVEPYFQRTWDHFSSHSQTPPDKVSKYAAATLSGAVAYVNFPVFGAFARHGNYPYRLLVRNLIARLMPEPLLTVEGPTGMEASVMRQQTPKPRTIVHLLQYSPERRAANLDLIEDIVPIAKVPISLKLDRRPRRVYLAPGNAMLPFTYKQGRAFVLVPEVRGHAMVVFE